MDNTNIDYSVYKRRMAAFYSTHHLPHYLGNPLLEAQPPLNTRLQIEAELKRRNTFYSPAMLTESFRVRADYARLLRNKCAIVRRSHVDLALEILRNQYARYAETDVFQRGYFSGVNSSTPSYMADEDDFNDGEDENIARHLSLIGPSGSGKTTALKMVFRMLPQVIVHNSYKGKKLYMKQVNYVRVLCPKKSGAKAVYTNFYSSFSRALNTIIKTRNWTEADLEDKIAADGRVSGIGFIWIDEIQNLLMQNNKMATETLAAFTRLTEMAGIPLILSGTPDVSAQVKAEMHTARRGAGFLPWKTMSPGEEFDPWLQELLLMPLTKVPLKFSKEISEYFYDYSQGIADPAASLYFKALEIVLDDERDEVRGSDLDKAKEHLYLMNQHLHKVREMRRQRLAKRLADAEAAKKGQGAKKPVPVDPEPQFDKVGA